jgi:SpoVK/Ycf46/Vps4 family AAA+-type ATPase
MGRKTAVKLRTSEDSAPLRDRLFEKGSSYAPVERSEIVGIDSLVDQLDELIRWLRNPEWFAQYNARLEPGIVFAGDPGTGKTMAARYLASSSDALFIAVRDWPTEAEMLTAADIADLFRRARESYSRTNRSVILFWDEFEIYAGSRRDSTTRDASVVSQLMSELDGVSGKCAGVLLVGCTNYRNAVDSALLRHGRLGKTFSFTAPDRNGKISLLRYYLGKHGPTVDLDLEAASYFLPGDASAATIEEACESVWRKAVGVSMLEGTKPAIS